MGEYKPEEMAIESPLQGKKDQSRSKLGRAQGVARAAGLQKKIPKLEYAPKKIKKSITGNGKATKEQLAKVPTNALKFKHKPENKIEATEALGAA
jgi:Holliday junction resolvasome, endonuclease subunit